MLATNSLDRRECHAATNEVSMGSTVTWRDVHSTYTEGTAPSSLFKKPADMYTAHTRRHKPTHVQRTQRVTRVVRVVTSRIVYF